MRNQVFLLTTLVAIFLFSCQKQEPTEFTPQVEPAKTFKAGVDDPCYEESFTIYGGQTIEVGTLTVSNDEDEIFVTYDLSGTDWHLDETHVFIGRTDDMPLNGGGNPKIGRFPFSESHNGEQVYTYTFLREDFDDCFTVATHAVVEQYDANGNKIGEETAWADGGTEFPGKRWGWYVEEFCSEDCVPDFDPCMTAYAYFPFRDIAPYNEYETTCFTDLGFDEFGWTKGPLPATLPPLPVCVDGFLYGCEATCEPQLTYDWLSMIRVHALGSGNNEFRVFFDYVKDGYQIKNTYVYVGTEPLPTVNGIPTIDPQDFPFQHLDVNSDFDEFIFPNFDEDFYVVGFAEFEAL